MADRNRLVVLADARWAALEPLIAARRPRGETRHHALRRTIEAIIGRPDNGAKWRSTPPELGPWWMAAQTFNRWGPLGVWGRLPEAARAGGVALGMAFLDRTGIRAHQKAAGAARRRGGASGAGRARGARPLTRRLRDEGLRSGRGGRARRQLRHRARAGARGAHRARPAGLLAGHVPGWVVGGRGLASSRAFRQRIRDRDARPALPPKRDEEPVACPPWICDNRNRVERLWARLKEWRAVATRHEKTARASLDVLCMAATMDWLKVLNS